MKAKKMSDEENNLWKEKLTALLTGLRCKNLEEWLKEDDILQFKRLGTIYYNSLDDLTKNILQGE